MGPDQLSWLWLEIMQLSMEREPQPLLSRAGIKPKQGFSQTASSSRKARLYILPFGMQAV